MGKAYSDVGTRIYLKLPTETVFKQLICPTSVPDLGGASENLDSTDMCDSVNTSVPGRESLPEMAFEFWYTGEKMEALEPYKKIPDTEMVIALPDSYGYHYIGQGDSWVSGYGVNALIPATYQFYPTWRSDLLTPSEVSALVPQTVTVNPISDRAVAIGSDLTVPVTTTPTTATIAASSSDPSVATVTVNNKVVTVTGVSAGSAVIEVTGSDTGYASGIAAFTVTVS